MTSAYKNEAANWGFEEMIDHDERYVKAREHMEVALQALGQRRARCAGLRPPEWRVLQSGEDQARQSQGQVFQRSGAAARPAVTARAASAHSGRAVGPGLDLAASMAEMQFVPRAPRRRA